MKEFILWECQVHDAECRFYSRAMPLLRKAPIPLPFRVPQLYASRPCPSEECVAGGFLLMEDLKGSGPPVMEVGVAEGLTKAQVGKNTPANLLFTFHL